MKFWTILHIVLNGFEEVDLFITLRASTCEESISPFSNIYKVFIFLASFTLLFWNNFKWLWIKAEVSELFTFLWTS